MIKYFFIYRLFNQLISVTETCFFLGDNYRLKFLANVLLANA